MLNTFIDKEIYNAGYEVLKYLWAANRLFDRACDQLKTKFSMYNMENCIHHNMAHIFPVYSDIIVDAFEAKNQSVEYPHTPDGKEEYNDPLQLVDTLLSFAMSVQEKITNMTKVCWDKLDVNTFHTCLELTEKLNNQVINPLIKLDNLLCAVIKSDDGYKWVDFDNAHNFDQYANKED